MTLTHPHALRGSNPPGAVTYGGETYPVGDDGAVDVPETVAADIAAAWADRYDEPAESFYADAGTDLESMTYDELYGLAKERDIAGRSEMDSAELRAALAEE